MPRMMGTMRRAGDVLLALALGGCASGDSRVERFAEGIHAVDGAAVIGALWLAHTYARPWSEHVEDRGGGRYRLEVTRAAWSGAGEGDFARRLFDLGSRTCAEYRLLSYRERLDPGNLAGAGRIAEGLIDCSAP